MIKIRRKGDADGRGGKTKMRKDARYKMMRIWKRE